MSRSADDDFWAWFVSQVLPTLARREVPGQQVIEELDHRMMDLALSWELGPATNEGSGWSFAVSFGADSSRIDLAQSLVNAAPKMDGCQVLLGKPPKRWNGVLDLPTRGGTIRFYTASWRCYILPMNGGVAIMVSPVGVDNDVDEESVSMAAAIAVQGELGEFWFARHVRDLSVVNPEQAEGLPGIRLRMSELRSAIAGDHDVQS